MQENSIFLIAWLSVEWMNMSIIFICVLMFLSVVLDVHKTMCMTEIDLVIFLEREI